MRLPLLAVLLAGQFLSLSPPAAAQGEAPDLGQLLAQVKDKEDEVNARVFTSIASFRSQEAFDTLRRAMTYLRNENRLNSGYRAFVGFAQDAPLAQRSIEYLHGEAKSHNREENQRAATRGLAAFGKPAFEELEQLLARHRDESIRRIAAQPLIPRLGEVGTKKAAETILAYAVLRSGSDEQAILKALVACEGSKVDALFSLRVLDTSTPERWRTLLLSVLTQRKGRAVDKTLVEMLRDPSADIRTRVLELLGERGSRGSLKKIRRHLKSDHEGELRQAIETLGKLSGGDEDWEDELLDLSRDGRAAARLGAAAALLELRTVPAVEALHRLLQDSDWRVRVEALQQVANLRRKASIPALIERMEVERGRLRRDVSLVLRLVTGLDHGQSAARWRQWWATESTSFEVPSLKDAVAAEGERATRRRTNQTTATFYGLEVVSDRVAFVVDTSGSMSAKAGTKGRTQSDKSTGSTRLAVAKQELTGALKGISPGVLFNIVFFSSGVSPWQDELLIKDAEVQAEAIEFAERQNPGGGTNIYDGLMAAFEDRRVDTIYLLSDGDPTAGTVVDPTLILERIAKLNRVRKVQIHCISIGKRSRFLERLAEQNGGVYKESL